MISGMVEPENESDDEKLVLSRLKEETGINEDIIQQNIDKIHPIGQPEERLLELLQYAKEKSTQLSKKLGFIMQICMGISKLY